MARSELLMKDYVTELQAGREARFEAEAKYRSLVEHIPAVLHVDLPDEAMTPVYISPQIERLIGVGPQEYRNDTSEWYERLHPDDRERALEEFRRGVAGGDSFTVEYRIAHRDGRMIWIRDEAVVLKDEEGHPTLVQGVMVDITERKLAEEPCRRARSASGRPPNSCGHWTR